MSEYKFIIKKILFFTLSFFICVSSFIYPVAAGISSVDSCMEQPHCGGAFARNQVKGELVKSTSTAKNNIVRFRRVNVTTGAVKESLEKTITTILPPLFGLGSNGNSPEYVNVNESLIDDLREQARDNYCAATNDEYGVCNLKLLIINRSQTVDFVFLSPDRFELFHQNGTSLVTNPWVRPSNHLYPDTLTDFDSFSLEDNRTIYGKINGKIPWEDISHERRLDIIENYLTEEEIVEKLKTNITVQPSPLSTPEEDEKIEIQVPLITDGTIISAPSNYWYTLSQTTTGTSTQTGSDTQTDSDGDNDTAPSTTTTITTNPDGSVTTVTSTPGGGSTTLTEYPDNTTTTTTIIPNGDGTSTVTTKDKDGNTTTTVENDEDLEEDDEENPDSIPETVTEVDPENDPDVIVEPEIEVLEPVEFNSPNFLSYGVSVMSDKFPFDILGDIDSGAFSSDCPSYEFFGREFELCAVRDLIVAFKYPVIIAFLIKSYHSI